MGKQKKWLHVDVSEVDIVDSHSSNKPLTRSFNQPMAILEILNA